jgi:hypothetical protein
VRTLASERFLLPLLLALPLVVSVSSLADPFGQSESSLNAAIWGLGARNIVEKGFVEAKLGALVAPFHGVKDGIYAHHPPLPIWLSVFTVLAHGQEAVPRALAVLCVIAALWLVYMICRRETSAFAALLAVGFASCFPYVLVYARLLTTLTIAAPLFLWLLYEVLGKRRTVPVSAAAMLLALSSWDGVIAGSAVCAFVLFRRDWALAKPLFAVFAAGVAFDAFYIANASGGFSEVLHQAVWRSGVNDESLTLSAFARVQWRFISAGLSLVGIAAILLRVALTKKQLPVAAAFWLALVPGLAMTLLFRHGAQRHAFWAYQLWIAAAFALAALLSRIQSLKPRLLCVLVFGAAAAVNVVAARERLLEERALDRVGDFALHELSAFTGSPVKMLASTSFQVYIPWYLRYEIDVALTPDDFTKRAWPDDARVMIDQLWLTRYGCRLSGAPLTGSPGGRFVIAQASTLVCPN